MIYAGKNLYTAFCDLVILCIFYCVGFWGNCVTYVSVNGNISLIKEEIDVCTGIANMLMR